MGMAGNYLRKESVLTKKPMNHAMPGTTCLFNRSVELKVYTPSTKRLVGRNKRSKDIKVRIIIEVSYSRTKIFVIPHQIAVSNAKERKSLQPMQKKIFQYKALKFCLYSFL